MSDFQNNSTASCTLPLSVYFHSSLEGAGQVFVCVCGGGGGGGGEGGGNGGRAVADQMKY